MADVEMWTHRDNRGFVLVISGREIASFDYDNGGWGGIAAARLAVTRTAEACGQQVTMVDEIWSAR